MPDAAALLAPLRARPASSVLAVDFDGTLAPIVSDPAAARPVEGSLELLASLARSYRDVIVVSGRPLDFLEPILPAEVSVVGLYGLEGADHGTRWEHPNGGAWRETMADLATAARRDGPAAMRVELKGLSITLHYRNHPELADDVRALASAQASRAGVLTRDARMSVELHPPIDSDKGTVIDRLTVDAEAVLYAGDDVGDLPAFDARDRLAARGAHVVRVAVVSDEAPAELIDRADLRVAGPAELGSVFGSLVVE